MEKSILQWSYWLGLICVLLAGVLRALNVLGWHEFATKGNPIGYKTFLDGGTLLLLLAVATAGFLWSKRQG